MRFDLEALRSHPGQPFHLDGDLSIPDLEWQGRCSTWRGWSTWGRGRAGATGRWSSGWRSRGGSTACAPGAWRSSWSGWTRTTSSTSSPRTRRGGTSSSARSSRPGFGRLRGSPSAAPAAGGSAPSAGRTSTTRTTARGATGGDAPDPRLSKLRGLLDELPSAVRVLGVDPGLAATGYAVVAGGKDGFVVLEAGTIRTRADSPLPERLGRSTTGSSGPWPNSIPTGSRWKRCSSPRTPPRRWPRRR